MKKLLSIFYFVAILNTCLTAQSDFRPGFVILNTNDTTYGWIDFKGDLSNSRLCNFKSSESAPSASFTPYQIKGYRFTDDKYYISKEVILNGEKEQKFLEFLLDGIVDLYCYRDMNGTSFFIEKEGEDLVEIKELESVTTIDGRQYISKDQKYIGRLKYLFADAPEIQDEIENVTINRKSLIDISKDYHEQVCKDNKCVIYTKKLADVMLNIGPVAGITALSIIPETLEFQANGDPHTYDCNFEKSTAVCYGLFANVNVPLVKSKLVFQYQGLVSSNTFTSTRNKLYEFSLNSTDLTHYFSVRYDFLKSKWHPFILAGGFINQKLKLETTGINQNAYRVDIFQKDIYLGFSIGTGLAYEYKKNREALLKITYSRGYGSFIYFNTEEINLTLAIPVFQIKLN